MELNLIKEQMAHDYSRSVEIYPDVEAAVDSAFKAGFDARQQLLQQTDCSTLRELLAEMLSEEKKQFDNFSKDYFERLKHAQNVASITDVMRMIDERQLVNLPK